MTGSDVVTAAEPQAMSKLPWGLRQYSAVLVVLILAAVALSLAQPSLQSNQTYEAAALVLATELEMDPPQLPATVDAIFRGGSIAEAVASQLPAVGPAGDLVPETIDVEPLTDTIAVRVIGRSSQPAAAAELANVAAFSLVSELNRLGPGVGHFVLSDRARPPLPSAEPSSVVTRVALGAVGGGAVGLGVIGLLLLVNRPVISGAEAAGILALPLLATLELARQKRVRMESVRGLALLTEQLFPAGGGLCLLVGMGRDTRIRHEVMELVGRRLGPRQPVCLVAPAPENRRLESRTASGLNVRVLDLWSVVSGIDPLDEFGTDTAVLLSMSGRAFDVPQLNPVGARVLLLVAEGTPRGQLESTARQFGPGDVQGIVFVERRRRIGRSPREAPPTQIATTKLAPRGNQNAVAEDVTPGPDVDNQSDEDRHGRTPWRQ